MSTQMKIKERKLDKLTRKHRPANLLSDYLYTLSRHTYTSMIIDVSELNYKFSLGEFDTYRKLSIASASFIVDDVSLAFHKQWLIWYVHCLLCPTLALLPKVIR